MKELRKYMDEDWVYIEVSDKEYAEALEQAKKDLDIKTEDEAEEREDEIDDYIIDYFEEYFEEQLERDIQDAEDQEDYYRELNSWLNKKQGV